MIDSDKEVVGDELDTVLAGRTTSTTETGKPKKGAKVTVKMTRANKQLLHTRLRSKFPN